MPLIRRWQRMPVVYQWATLCGALVIMLSASIVAVIGLLTAQDAGRRAQSAVACVNNVLGERGATTTDSAVAQQVFAAADKTYNAAVNALLDHPPRTPQERVAARRTFRTASRVKEDASNAYQRAMTRIVATARAHPLGRC